MKRSADGTEIVRSGVEVDEHSLIWEIQNFSVVLEDDSMITSQRIEFSAGGGIGQSSKWTAFLKEETPPPENDGGQTRKGLGIYCQVLEPPTAARDNLYSRAEFVFRNEKGKKLGGAETSLLDSSSSLGGPWGISKAIDVKKNSSVVLLQIHVTFKLYTPSGKHPNPSGLPTLTVLKDNLATKARKDLAGLLQKGAPATTTASSDSYVKLVSSDKKEFSIPRKILKARAPEFETTLPTGAPVSKGVHRLRGITGSTLEILISFIYTGELPEDWEGRSEVAVELTHVAGKYQLSELLQLLDGMLENACDLENVVPLLILANKYSMKMAEEGLLKFVRDTGASSAKNFSEMISRQRNYFFAKNFPALRSKLNGTTMIMRTGVDLDEQSFVWEITNFPVLAMKDSMIDSQSITFKAGETINQLTQWNLFLRACKVDGKRLAGLCYRAEKRPMTTTEYLKSKLYVSIKSHEGTEIYDGETSWRDITEFVQEDDTDNRDKMIDLHTTPLPESLEIHVRFMLLSPAKPTSEPLLKSVQPVLKNFLDNFTATCRTELAGLAHSEGCDGDDIIILSNNQREFKVSRGILGARSPVFAAMMRSNMTEANDGVIRISDMTGALLEVMLHFIYTGELLPEWKNVNVIAELTNAAAKYQLNDLLQFLDQALGKVCDLDSVVPLLTLASQLSLATAEKELLKFVRETGASCIENFSQIMKSVSE